jgi:hypothetical protein
VFSSGEAQAFGARIRRARLGLAFALGASLAVICGAPGTSAAQRLSGGHPGWSAPSVLGECALGVGPQVAFPSDSPSTPTGPGAIVWARAPGGCSPSSHRPTPARAGLGVAALSHSGQPSARSAVSLGGWAVAGLGVVGASFGRIAVALPSPSSPGEAPEATAVLEGRANRPLGTSRLLAGGSVPPALARGYLGDVTIATVVPGPAIAVRTQRYFSSGFAPARLIPLPQGRVTALRATMDYRSDVLLAWQQNGAIYARMLHADGRLDPAQRIGSSQPNPVLQPLVSDDDRGFVAWSTTAAPNGSVPVTRIYVDRSADRVRFPAPLLLASFADPQELGRSPGSLQLVRLSSENVMLAWTAAEHGHYVVRAAPVVYAVSGPTVRLSDPHRQAVLAGLAPGPAREAVALWKAASSPREIAAYPSHTELWAARTFIGLHDRIGADEPEMILPSGPQVAPAVAVDPAGDRAVVAWLTPGGASRIEYAMSLGAVGDRPAAAASSSWVIWPSVALAVAAVLAAIAFLKRAPRRRRRRRRVSSPR